MDEVERIAKGLSWPLRQRLLNVATLIDRGVFWASDLGSLSARTSRATTPVLIDLGLLYVEVGYCRPTPLGLAVRDYLRGMDHD